MPNKPPHDPTPEQIREACKAIRRDWSEREHHRRAGRVVDSDGLLPYVVPTVKRGGESRGKIV